MCLTGPLPRPQKPNARAAAGYFAVLAVLVFFALVVSGCATSQSSPDSNVLPKSELTLSGTLDGRRFEGVGLGSAEKSHTLVFESVVDVNMFTAQTCHRSISFQDLVKQGWIARNRSYQWQYDQSPGLEDTGDCILRLCSFSKTVGAAPVSCAAIDFKNSAYQLPFTNICNGTAGSASGTALCHTMKGLSERVQFKGTVLIAPPVKDESGREAPIVGQCEGRFVDAAQTVWEYTMPSRECRTIFLEKAQPHRRAKLTAIPYDVPKYIGSGGQ